MGPGNGIEKWRGLGVLLIVALAAWVPAGADWDDEPDVGGGNSCTLTVDTSPSGSPEPGLELAADPPRLEENPAAQSSLWTLLVRLGDRLAEPLLAWLAY